jgi:hypothetical protein
MKQSAALYEDISRFIYSGKTAAFATSMAMAAYNVTSNHLLIPESQWAELGLSVRVGMTSPFMSWSPLLRNDMERTQFEPVCTGS